MKTYEKFKIFLNLKLLSTSPIIVFSLASIQQDSKAMLRSALTYASKTVQSILKPTLMPSIPKVTQNVNHNLKFTNDSVLYKIKNNQNSLVSQTFYGSNGKRTILSTSNTQPQQNNIDNKKNTLTSVILNKPSILNSLVPQTFYGSNGKRTILSTLNTQPQQNNNDNKKINLTSNIFPKPSILSSLVPQTFYSSSGKRIILTTSNTQNQKNNKQNNENNFQSSITQYKNTLLNLTVIDKSLKILEHISNIENNSAKIKRSNNVSNNNNVKLEYFSPINTPNRYENLFNNADEVFFIIPGLNIKD